MAERFRFRLCLFVALAAVGLFRPVVTNAQDAPEAPRRWAVIIVGLPGDAEHQPLFRETSAAWKKWCEQSLQIPSDRLRLLTAATETTPPEPSLSPTRENLAKTFQELAGQVREGDSLWVFTLGHGNGDGQRAWLHLPGPDLSANDLAEWLNAIPCQEQVVWLTQASSGGWIKPLARDGRIVITATADDTEENETEFPQALVTAMALPPDKLDADSDKHVSLLEVFQRAVQETQTRFDADKRLATEHAQLDDNGDGRGTEADKLAAPEANVVTNAPPTAPTAATARPADGAAARKLLLFDVPTEVAPAPQP